MSRPGRPGVRRTLRLAAIVVIGAAVIAGAILWGRERREREVAVEGRTIDSSGAPVADVDISLEIEPVESEGELPVEHVVTRSDARGRFSIRCRPPWRHPSFSLEASKPGFETVTIDDADALPNPLTLRLAAVRP